MKKVALVLVFTMYLGSVLAQQPALPVKSVKTLSSTDSLMVKQWFFAGLREKTVENFQLATDMFRRVTDLDPGNAAALYELATLHTRQNQDKKAEEYIKAAVDLRPDNQWYLILLADIYKRQNNLTDLVPVFDRLISINPSNEDFYFDKANALLLQNKTTEANGVYDQIEQEFGPSEDLVEARQRNLVQSGKPEKAVAELEKQLKESPQELKNYLYLSDLYTRSGQKDKALNILRRARDLEPGNALVRLALADIYRSSDQTNEAFIELKEAFADANLQIDQKVRIVLSFFPSFSDVRARAQAEELASIITKVHPDDPKSFAVYGDVLFQGQKYPEAKTAYRKALSLNDQVYLIWEQLLRIEVSDGDFTSALKDGEEALSLFPNQAPLYLYTGIAYAQSQKHEKAVSYLKNAVSLETEDHEALAQIYSALGDSYYALRRLKESDEAYEKSLEYGPNNTYTLNNYAYYLSLREEELEKAAEMSRKSNVLEPNNPSFEDTLAWILFKMKKYQEARSWMEKALADGKENSGTQFEHYGDILYNLGEADLAVVQWKKALQAGSKSPLLPKKINEKKYYK